MASVCLQRWALILSSYSYSVKYKKNSLQGNADTLSRLPLSNCPDVVPIASEVIASLEQLSIVPLSVTQLRTLTSRNPVLAKITHFVYTGWPLSLQDELTELKPFWYRKH